LAARESCLETELTTHSELSRMSLRRLWLFLALSLLVSWIIWLAPFERPGSIYIVVFGKRFDSSFFFIKLLLGNCIPGMLAICFALSEGKHQFLQLLSTLVRWRVPLKWYLLAFVLPLGIFWVSLGVVSLYIPAPHLLPSLTRVILYAVLAFPLGPLWGELAWRAYALRKLQTRYSQLTSSVMLGLYWAVWLIPLWLTTRGASSTRVQELAAAITTILAWSIICTSLYNRSGQSLPVVILLEAVQVASADEIFARVQDGRLLFIWLSAALTVLIAAGLARRMVNDSSLGHVRPSG
jgi:hypothetical protein